MMSDFAICKVVADPSRPNDQIAIPRNILEKLSMKVGERIRVVLSNLSEQVLVTQSSDTCIHLSKPLASRFQLTGGRLSVRKQNKSLRLGPILALYVVGNAGTERPFPNMTRLVADMIRMGEELGMYVYAVTPGGFNFSKRTVYGARFHDSTWQWGQQPFPEVVLRKAVTFPKQLYKIAREELKILQQNPHVQLLGKDIGDKWDVYTLLKKHSRNLKQILPESHLYKQPETIFELLRTHPVVYIKPVRGTQGKGIIRVKRLTQSGGTYSIEDANGVAKRPKQLIKKSDIFTKTIRKHLNKNKRYIVQQGIDLLQNQQRIIDFRWLVQKLPNQNWEVTARICRVAKSDQIATNLHMGGQALAAESVLNKYQGKWNKSTSEIIRDADRIAIEIAKALDQRIGRNVEFGIDIAIDVKGKIWILEVNPRPGRKMLRLCQPEVRKLSLLRPLEYAKYATGYSEQR
jgi:YheC/D like ATP-grasp